MSRRLLIVLFSIGIAVSARSPLRAQDVKRPDVERPEVEQPDAQRPEPEVPEAEQPKADPLQESISDLLRRPLIDPAIALLELQTFIERRVASMQRPTSLLS